MPAAPAAAAKLTSAAVDILWRQWRALGAAATGKPVRAQVDPEVLCLASLAFEEAEPRLWIAMADWLRTSARLISVQRLKNLAGQLAGAGEQMPRLASTVVRDSGDARWRSLMPERGRTLRIPPPVRARTAGAALDAPPALMLRLRAAFGVGVKADLLAFLLGQRLRVSVATAAHALGHSKATVFRALQDLREAGMVHVTNQPAAAEYWLDAGTWSELLGGRDAIAGWGWWREIFSYVTAATHQEASGSDYARAVTLRALAETHEPSLVRAGVLGTKLSLPRTPDLAEWRSFHAQLADRIIDRA